MERLSHIIQYKVVYKSSGMFNQTVDSSHEYHYREKLINGTQLYLLYDRRLSTYIFSLKKSLIDISNPCDW